jgi:hypothetical protein
MESPSVRKKRLARVERVSERSRLEEELLVAAYEFACPLVRQRLGSAGKAKVKSVTTACHNQTAAGGRSA